MSVQTAYEHIAIDEDDVPFIDGTSIKVVELVLDHKAYGWSPEELHFQHPELTLGQIHSALAYYWDHTDSLHKDLHERLERTDRLRSQAASSPLQERLRKQH